ncbi:hypothetical protein [Sphingomonas sp.]|uniref:hypothetical protein n=1 Tax=Sphingomonas sp. TaxID=28214 RepID=UPI0025DC60A1|nr:hypothetical protein [Sphingomonas sp.]MBV9527637.1 hypothetical protein [Sphingomonas sp.]
MNAFWAFFWPLVGFGMLAGVLSGIAGFRRRPGMLVADYRRRRVRFPAGAAMLCVAAALLWTGPLGGAGRLVAAIDKSVHDDLVYYEMTPIQANLHRAPLTRRLALSGPADDFQREQLSLVLSDLPGVSSAMWGDAGGGIPLVVEAAIAALLGFAIGLVPAYGVELRRRYNAQWSW